MSGLIMAAQLILGLSILVTLHELGHYLAARAFGIRVEKFYLFFDAWGFKLFSFTKGETEYGIGWLPFGGYVKIAGMIDESMDKGQMAGPPQPWEFRSKPAWQRLIVMIGGVTMNVILGIIIFSFTLMHYKKEFLPNENVTNGIYAYTLGEAAGLQTGDKVIAINGKAFERFEDLLSTRVLFGAHLTVLRNGQQVEIEIPDDLYKTASAAGPFNFVGAGKLCFLVGTVDSTKPAAKAGILEGDKIYAINGKEFNATAQLAKTIDENKGGKVTFSILREKEQLTVDCNVSDEGTVGIGYNPSSLIDPSYVMRSYNAMNALEFGTSDAMEALVSNIKGLKKIFTGQEKATDAVQGPIGIAKIYGSSFDWPWFWRITGLLSMILAFMNMLPIPALDGGHVIFLLIESVTRYKFSDKFMERSQIVGMVILLGIMLFAFGNDIFKHVIN